jgi:hypothetical protein
MLSTHIYSMPHDKVSEQPADHTSCANHAIQTFRLLGTRHLSCVRPDGGYPDH